MRRKWPCCNEDVRTSKMAAEAVTHPGSPFPPPPCRSPRGFPLRSPRHRPPARHRSGNRDQRSAPPLDLMPDLLAPAVDSRRIESATRAFERPRPRCEVDRSGCSTRRSDAVWAPAAALRGLRASPRVSSPGLAAPRDRRRTDVAEWWSIPRPAALQPAAIGPPARRGPSGHSQWPGTAPGSSALTHHRGQEQGPAMQVVHSSFNMVWPLSGLGHSQGSDGSWPPPGGRIPISPRRSSVSPCNASCPPLTQHGLATRSAWLGHSEGGPLPVWPGSLAGLLDLGRGRAGTPGLGWIVTAAGRSKFDQPPSLFGQPLQRKLSTVHSTWSGHSRCLVWPLPVFGLATPGVGHSQCLVWPLRGRATPRLAGIVGRVARPWPRPSRHTGTRVDRDPDGS